MVTQVSQICLALQHNCLRFIHHVVFVPFTSDPRFTMFWLTLRAFVVFLYFYSHRKKRCTPDVTVFALKPLSFRNDWLVHVTKSMFKPRWNRFCVRIDDKLLTQVLKLHRNKWSTEAEAKTVFNKTACQGRGRVAICRGEEGSWKAALPPAAAPEIRQLGVFIPASRPCFEVRWRWVLLESDEYKDDGRLKKRFSCCNGRCVNWHTLLEKKKETRRRRKQSCWRVRLMLRLCLRKLTSLNSSREKNNQFRWQMLGTAFWQTHFAGERNEKQRGTRHKLSEDAASILRFCMRKLTSLNSSSRVFQRRCDCKVQQLFLAADV